MRKPLSLIEMYCALLQGVKRQRRQSSAQLSRAGATLGRRVSLGHVLMVSLLTVSVETAAQAPPTCPPLGPASRTIWCRPDAAAARLFTPRDVPSDTYRVFASTSAIETLAAAFADRSPAGDRAPGAWTVQEMEPLSAFGEAGAYDETKVARLYVGRRARVAHGPIVEGGRTVASITLISPYPDATLTRLVDGTLIIEFRVPNVVRSP